MSPVSVRDVGVLLQEEGDLFVRVQAYPLGNQHRPVVVAAQFDVVRRLQQLLGHLQQHVDPVAPPAPGELCWGVKAADGGRDELDSGAASSGVQQNTVNIDKTCFNSNR